MAEPSVPNRDRASGMFPALVIGGLVLGLCVLLSSVVPAIQTAREASRLAACENTMRAHALAAVEFADGAGQFHPPALGEPSVSWRIGLGEPLESVPVTEFLRGVPWDDPANQPLHEPTPPTFVCLSSESDGGRSNYVYPTGPSSLWAYEEDAPGEFGDGMPGRRVESDARFGDLASLAETASVSERIEAIGRSYRLLEVERLTALPVWCEPADTPDDWQPTVAPLPTAETALLSSAHIRGAYGAMFDGSVRLFAFETDPRVIATFVSPEVIVPDVPIDDSTGDATIENNGIGQPREPF